MCTVPLPGSGRPTSGPKTMQSLLHIIHARASATIAGHGCPLDSHTCCPIHKVPLPAAASPCQGRYLAYPCTPCRESCAPSCNNLRPMTKSQPVFPGLALSHTCCPSLCPCQAPASQCQGLYQAFPCHHQGEAAGSPQAASPQGPQGLGTAQHSTAWHGAAQHSIDSKAQRQHIGFTQLHGSTCDKRWTIAECNALT